MYIHFGSRLGPNFGYAAKDSRKERWAGVDYVGIGRPPRQENQALIPEAECTRVLRTQEASNRAGSYEVLGGGPYD